MSLMVSKSSSEGVFLLGRDAPRPWKIKEKEIGVLFRAYMLGEAVYLVSAEYPRSSCLFFPRNL